MAAMLLYLLVLEGRLSKGSWRWSAIVGCGFGAMAVVSMLFPITVRPGILSDAKFTLTVFSAAYGGPLAGAITVLIAGAFRGLLGGLGFYVTIPVLLASWALGLLYARWSLPAQGRARRAVQLLLLGYTLSLLQLLGLSFFLFFMEWKEVLGLMRDFALPILVVFPPFSVLLGLALDFIDSRHHIGELQKRTASALEKRNKEIEVLNDVFHHELRTPVVSLQGFMSDLRENAREGKMQEVLQDVEYLQKATDRIAVMLDALVKLNHAGMRSGREPVSRLPGVVDPVLQRWPALRLGTCWIPCWTMLSSSARARRSRRWS